MNENPNSKNNSPANGKNLDSIHHIAPKITVSSAPPKRAQVNLLSAKQKKSPKRIFRKIIVSIILIIIVLGTVITLRAANLSEKIFVGKKTTFFSQIYDIIRGGGNNDKLIGEDLGQVNILLLGIGGEGHDGPYLTDTMILVQIRPDIGEASLISIPRDYLVNLPDNFGANKINAAFTLGFNKNKDWDEAGSFARQQVENISGLKIPYFAVIDFAGFEEAIGKVNGLDVHVDRTFTDYTYPDNGIGYLPPITFTEGLEHMDGTKALQFARSRHAAGPEGSDFARSARQQKIIDAFKQRVLGLNLITNAGTLNSLLSTFANHFHTNIAPANILRLYNLIKEKSIKSTVSLSLDPSISIICPKIMEDTGAYVLVPCEGKSEIDVKNFFKNIFVTGKVTAEKSVIWLSSSTGDRVAYAKADQKLKEAGLTVWELPYKGQALSTNVVYQANSKPATTEFIKNVLHATEVTLAPPGVNVDRSKVDIILILGQNE